MIKINKGLINAFITFSTTLLGVIVGGIMTYRLNLKFQSKVIRKQVKIEELKKVLKLMNDFTDSLLALEIKYMFLNTNKPMKNNIDSWLTYCNDQMKCLSGEMFLNQSLFKEYDIAEESIKKEFNMISEVIDYKIKGYGIKIDEYEKYLEEKPMNERINILISRIKYYIVELQEEYAKDL